MPCRPTPGRPARETTDGAPVRPPASAQRAFEVALGKAVPAPGESVDLTAPPGESFVFTTPVYGGTHHLIHTLLEPLGFKPIAVPAGDGAALERAIQGAEDLRLVFLEIPANPTLVMTDIRRAVEAARRHPRALGADLVIYSATKYLAGFSDMLEVLPVAAPFSTRTRTGSRPGSGDRSDGWRRPRPIGRRRQSGRRC